MSEPAGPRDFRPLAGPRQPWYNSLLRVLGIAWLGVLTFAVYPPPPDRVAVQAACYAVTLLAIAATVILNLPGAGTLAFDPRAALGASQPAWLAGTLGVMAVATGFASATGTGATFLVIYTALAAVSAGGDLALGPAVAVTAAGVLAIELGGLLYQGGTTVFVGFPLIVASCLVIGRNRAAYRVQAQQAAALLAQRERLADADRRASTLDERARIAREIHDVLAHSLGALSIQIQAARSVLTDRGDIEQACELLAAAQKMAGEGLTETRRAVHALRTGSEELAAELARAAGSFAQRFGVAASFAASGEPRPVPPEATVALLRVAQESVVNAAKHAPGQPVTLTLEFGRPGAVLTVRNDLAPGSGAGAPGVHTADAGYGLTGMRERLLLLDGALEAGQHDGQWVVTARVPLPSPAASPGGLQPEASSDEHGTNSTIQEIPSGQHDPAGTVR